MLLRLTAFLVLLVSLSLADFTADFRQWLDRFYGPAVRQQMERLDLGEKGSFGGRDSPTEILVNQPVVFVHGVSDTAGEKMTEAANYYRAHGSYKTAELYSTTYFNGAQGNPLKWAEYTMRCEYVKQVRALIVAVRLYTGRAVDVVAFSLGVPVSRKAILGGSCVETGEYLGGPLTRIVDSYVSVAGPNHGQSVQDINRIQHYEGLHVYSIYTRTDQIVGYQVCGKITSQVAAQDGEKVYDNLNHDQAFHNTHDVQISMIKDHVVP